MIPEIYNPCEHGFAAKAWECLRRNEDFKKVVRKLKATKTEEAFRSAWPHFFGMEKGRQYVFAEEALIQLVDPTDVTA